MEVVNAIGRRKAAVARVFVSEGTGKITINKRDLANYFPSTILQFIVKQPLAKLNVEEQYDIKINLDGGGFKGQSEAARLAIARALIKINPEDKCQVHERRALVAQRIAQLAYRFDERQRLDVAHRTADLGVEHVDEIGHR